MKGWMAVVGAAALMASSGASAQSAEGLLNILKRGALNVPKAAVQQARSPYIGPVGMYWDHDSEQLHGVQHVRHGLVATGRSGSPTCDMELVAMAHSNYSMSPIARSNCTRSEYNIVERVQGDAAAGQNDNAIIEQRFGPVLDARIEKFRGIHRFAARHNIQGEGMVYDAQRGVLDIYVPIPGATYAVGHQFVPLNENNGRATWSPKHMGRFRTSLRMSEEDYRALMRQGREPKDNLVVFTVNRVFTNPGAPNVPHYDLTVERVHVGFVGETIEIDLTNQQASH